MLVYLKKSNLIIEKKKERLIWSTLNTDNQMMMMHYLSILLKWPSWDYYIIMSSEIFKFCLFFSGVNWLHEIIFLLVIRPSNVFLTLQICALLSLDNQYRRKEEKKNPDFKSFVYDHEYKCHASQLCITINTNIFIITIIEILVNKDESFNINIFLCLIQNNL